jgi:hypothetical protein
VGQRELTSKLGLTYISIPLNSFDQIPQQAVDEFLRHALGPSSQPVFVHACLVRSNRINVCFPIECTMMVGLLKKAFEEAVSYGFKPFLLPLVNASGVMGKVGSQ